MRELYDAGRWAEAAAFGAGASPQTPTVILYRGLSLARIERLGDAAAVLRQGFRRYPGDARLAVESAGVAYRQGENGEAKHWLLRALRLNSADAYSNDFLGTIFLLDGNLPATLQYWNRIGKPLLHEVTFATPTGLDAILQARAFPISGGQVLSLQRYDQIYANLARLNVFARTSFDLRTNSNGDTSLSLRPEPLIIPFGGRAGQFLSALRGLPYQALTPEFYNINGRALNVTSLLRWDSDKGRIQVQLASPWRENPQIETSIFVDARDERWDLRRPGITLDKVTVRTLQAGGKVSFGLTEKLQWTTGLRAVVRDYPQRNDFAFMRKGWSAEISNRFDYALWRQPEHRIETRGWAQLRTGRFSDSRLIGLEAGVKGTWYPEASGDRYQVKAGFAASRLWGNAPLDELYSAGMERDNSPEYWLRGHPGARYGRKGTAPLGQEIEVGQLDVSRRLFTLPFIRSYLGPWFDWGRTAAGGRFESNGWLYDAGVEARVATLGGIQVRLIYGRDMRDGRGVFYTAISR